MSTQLGELHPIDPAVERRHPCPGGGGRTLTGKALMTLVRRLERLTRPRLAFLFRRHLTDVAFGLLVISGSAAAFLAPRFTGLDTLPSLGVVLLSLAVLLEDALIAAMALTIGVTGVAQELALGAAPIYGLNAIL